MPAGRPLKYKKEYCEQLIQHMAKGFSFESFAADLNTCRETLNKWANKFPEFLLAKKEGHEKSLKALEGVGIAQATGKLQGNVTAWIFLMKNKHSWADKLEVTGDSQKPLILKYKVDDEPSKQDPEPSDKE